MNLPLLTFCETHLKLDNFEMSKLHFSCDLTHKDLFTESKRHSILLFLLLLGLASALNMIDLFFDTQHTHHPLQRRNSNKHFEFLLRNINPEIWKEKI